MGYISKQINFGGRTIINENINTTMYNYGFAIKWIYVLEERRKSNKCIVTRVTIPYFS